MYCRGLRFMGFMVEGFRVSFVEADGFRVMI